MPRYITSVINGAKPNMMDLVQGHHEKEVEKCASFDFSKRAAESTIFCLGLRIFY